MQTLGSIQCREGPRHSAWAFQDLDNEWLRSHKFAGRLRFGRAELNAFLRFVSNSVPETAHRYLVPKQSIGRSGVFGNLADSAAPHTPG